MTLTRLIAAPVLLAWLIVSGVRCDSLENDLKDLFRTYDELTARRELQQQQQREEVAAAQDKRAPSGTVTDMLRKLTDPTERETLNRHEETRDMMDELLKLLAGLSEGMEQVQDQTDSGSGKTAPTNKFGRRSNIMRDQVRLQKATPNVAGRSMDKQSARFNTEVGLKKEVDGSKKVTGEIKKEQAINLEEPTRSEDSDPQRATRVQASYLDMLNHLLWRRLTEKDFVDTS